MNEVDTAPEYLAEILKLRLNHRNDFWQWHMQMHIVFIDGDDVNGNKIL